MPVSDGSVVYRDAKIDYNTMPNCEHYLVMTSREGEGHWTFLR